MCDPSTSASDLVVAQLVGVEVVTPDAGTERRDERSDLLAAEHAIEAGALDIEDLAAQRQHRLVLAVAPLLGRAAGRIALHDEQLRAVHGRARTVGELAGQAQLAGGRGAGDLLVLAPLQPLLGPLQHELQQGVGGLGLGGEPVVEGVA